MLSRPCLWPSYPSSSPLALRSSSAPCANGCPPGLCLGHPDPTCIRRTALCCRAAYPRATDRPRFAGSRWRLPSRSPSHPSVSRPAVPLVPALRRRRGRHAHPAVLASCGLAAPHRTSGAADYTPLASRLPYRLSLLLPTAAFHLFPADYVLPALASQPGGPSRLRPLVLQLPHVPPDVTLPPAASSRLPITLLFSPPCELAFPPQIPPLDLSCSVSCLSAPPTLVPVRRSLAVQPLYLPSLDPVAGSRGVVSPASLRRHASRFLRHPSAAALRSSTCFGEPCCYSARLGSPGPLPSVASSLPPSPHALRNAVLPRYRVPPPSRHATALHPRVPTPAPRRSAGPGSRHRASYRSLCFFTCPLVTVRRSPCRPSFRVAPLNCAVSHPSRRPTRCLAAFSR